METPSDIQQQVLAVSASSVLASLPSSQTPHSLSLGVQKLISWQKNLVRKGKPELHLPGPEEA